ncbi:MAG: lamin tail domain-containing protein [Methanophagales archaeon]|nr:lamin tail domain-containing protein [Methanophagales archaeon]
MPASAQPTANEFGVENALGDSGTNVMVPVNITNTQNGPIISIGFDIFYDNGVINVVGVQRGDLTSNWDSPSYNNFDWGTRVTIVYDGVTDHAIQNGMTGSVVLLNFGVSGTPGSTSRMNLTGIGLSDTEYTVGTAPAKNGTFTVTGVAATTGDIIINEIMYAPTATWGGSTNEWIELYNNDSKPINIIGWTIDDKPIPEAVMQPGDYLIIAKNDTKFYEFYPGITCSAKKVAISLKDDGETIYLNDSMGNVNDIVNYTEYASGGLGWGYKDNRTLERNATGGWEESLVEGGTPCKPNSVLAAPPVLTTIKVAPPAATLVVGGTQPFTATAEDQYGNPMTGINITWMSSNITVGTVTPKYAITGSDGNASTTFTAAEAGTTTIKAENKTVNGTASVTVTTAAPVLTTIKVTPPLVTLTVGETQQFTAQGYDQFGDPIDSGIVYTWSSSNEIVGTVNETGFFEALAVGKTLVNATNGTIVGSASVTVSSLTITDFTVDSSVKRGHTLNASVKIKNKGSSTINVTVVVSGLHNSTGYPIAGTGVLVNLGAGQEITLPVLVYVPTSANLDGYTLFADVWLYDDYPDETKAIYSGPKVTSVTS